MSHTDVINDEKVLLYTPPQNPAGINCVRERENLTESGPEPVTIYARVSTADQDARRQLNELRAWVADQYPDAATEEFADVVSGAATDRAEEYHALREAVAGGGLNLVVVDDISRLSRLGGGEIHDFTQYALQNDTSICDREVGLSINVGGSGVDLSVKDRYTAGM